MHFWQILVQLHAALAVNELQPSLAMHFQPKAGGFPSATRSFFCWAMHLTGRKSLLPIDLLVAMFTTETIVTECFARIGISAAQLEDLANLAEREKEGSRLLPRPNHGGDSGPSSRRRDHVKRVGT
jgi:hypothetical protein